MKVEWRGIFPAIITPFTPDDEIDWNIFSVNVNAQLQAGVNGIILGGSLGEASTLEAKEKKMLIHETKKLVKERAPVIMNIAEQSTSAAVKAAMAAMDEGADGLMLLPPMRYKADDRETVEYFKAVASAVPLPIMIYNNPVDYKIEVTPDMFEILAALENIQAIKDSTRDVSNITRTVNRFGNRFSIFCGVDTLALESFVLGANGWVGGLVNALPAETVAIYRLVKAGLYQEALEIYRWFLPLLELDLHSKLVQYIKLAASHTGIGSEYVRAPRLPLRGKEKETINQLIKTTLMHRPKLPEYFHLPG
jgi:1-pyrroline-4-hydroxy-2-carboxylate deaminase